MTGVIPVLLYHSVDDHPRPSDRRHTVSRAAFAAHTDAIRSSGRVAVRITELAAGLHGSRSLPERPVAVTFDDGFADTYDAVQALLCRDLPSTVYVTTGMVGAKNRLSSSQLVALGHLPAVELGAHAMRHRRLDELDEQELADEVRGSKTELEDLSEVSVLCFAYPHGAYDQRVRDAVMAADYRSAAPVKNALSHPRRPVRHRPLDGDRRYVSLAARTGSRRTRRAAGMGTRAFADPSLSGGASPPAVSGKEARRAVLTAGKLCRTALHIVVKDRL